MQSKPSDSSLAWFHDLANERIITQSVKTGTKDHQEIQWDVLRTDLIHPICSGNKFFKLKYYLEDAILNNYTTIHSFGGAWSNHIVATAFAAQASGLSSIGYIRGEEPARWSETLIQAKQYGMDLQFLSRKEFDKVYPGQDIGPKGSYPVPMGGYGLPGIKGASEILNYTTCKDYTHVFCAVGSGTMIAGLALSCGEAQLAGITVVKDHDALADIRGLVPSAMVSIYPNYQFSGYGRENNELFSFMNDFHKQNTIPTDFVYTGKLMFAIQDLLNNNAFQPGSKILAIHSGGLQGNKSLKIGTLNF
jgi:1-aminocyclopropane-1-carboxylate deaminase/D-cysteine desulfhydrase-like pyridoxal-dependent ACC family enzyme